MRYYDLKVTYLSGEVGSTTLRNLEDNGGLGIASSLEGSNDGGGGGDVLRVLSQHNKAITQGTSRATYDSGNRELVLAGILEEL